MKKDNQATTQGDDSVLPDQADIIQLKEELEEAQNNVKEMTVISQRALADLQNFKRRSEEEKSSFINGATVGVFLELLPTIESMHRALEHEQKDEKWVEGAVQSMQHFIQTSEKLGLKTVPTEGLFDPTQHEALLTAPGEKDQILEVLEKGYMLNDKIIKMARVKVGDGSTEETQSTE